VSSGIKLLGYVAATLFFFMAIMLLLTMRQSGRVRAATLWLWSTLIAAIAVALNTSQEVIPEFFGYVVSGVLLIVAPLISARGTFEYRYHRTVPVLWIYAVAALSMPAFYYFTSVAPNTGVRVLMVALPIVGICSWHAWIMLARLGGEEFCALLPQSDLAAAQISAEVLRKAFNLETAALGHSRQHTVSIGVAATGEAQTILRELMERADQALYRAQSG